MAMCAVALLFPLSAFAQNVPDKVKAALDSRSSRVRIAAIAAISKSKAIDAQGLIETKLKDDTATVRAAAVEALARIGNSKSIALVKQMRTDKSKLVKKIVEQSLVILEAKQRSAKSPRVKVRVFDVLNTTGLDLGDAEKQFRTLVDGALNNETRRRFELQDDAKSKGYGLMLKISAMKPFAQDAVKGVQVDCEVTVVELPSKNLRMNSRATTGAGIEGDLSDKMKVELTGDAISACAPALVEDFVDFIVKLEG